MSRAAALAILLAAAAAAPAAAADVDIAIPAAFLGGPTAAPLAPAEASATAGPNGRPAREPDPCAGAAKGDCVVVGRDAEVDPVPVPEPGPGLTLDDPIPDDPDTADDGEQRPAEARRRAAPALPPAPSELPTTAGGLIAPAAAGWLRWQTPLLTWRPRAGARYYNVQVFRGARRVLVGWARTPRLRVPAGVLDQGRVYTWVVWPGRGPRAAGRYGAPIGRSVFQVTLRPRVVVRARGAGGVVGEVRPRIPGALLALRPPAALSGRVPARVRVPASGLIPLGLAPAEAARLRPQLVERGPRPPIGLRRGL